MWTLLLACAARPIPELTLAERRRLEAEIRAATEALNEAPLGPEAVEYRDAVFTAQLTLGWLDEATAQNQLLIATTAPDSAWSRANPEALRAEADALIEAELRMLCLAWSERLRSEPADEAHAAEMLRQSCQSYRERFPDDPRSAQIAEFCPQEP